MVEMTTGQYLCVIAISFAVGYMTRILKEYDDKNKKESKEES